MPSDDHPGVGSSREASGEQEVGSTSGEAEAGTETNKVGDDGEDAVQGSVHDVEREAQEHEAELEGLGDAADEGADGSGDNQADSSLLVLSGLNHSQGSTRIPNIMQGKKPDMYIPRLHLTSAEVSPAQKWVRSPRPMVSNQNTLFRAWCRPVGMSRRLRKA